MNPKVLEKRDRPFRDGRVDWLYGLQVKTFGAQHVVEHRSQCQFTS